MIKKFEEFNFDIDPYGEEKWVNEFLFKVHNESHATIPEGVDIKNLEETIKYTFRSFTDEDTPHGAFVKKSHIKALRDYPDNEIVRSQYNATYEIRKKTSENYLINIENGRLTIFCDYEITLPNFDLDDVKDWVHENGISELILVHGFNEMENIVSGKGRNKQHEKINYIFKEIRKNARAIVI